MAKCNQLTPLPFKGLKHFIAPHWLWWTVLQQNNAQQFTHSATVHTR